MENKLLGPRRIGGKVSGIRQIAVRLLSGRAAKRTAKYLILKRLNRQLAVAANLITHPSNGANQRVARAGVQFSAQIINVYVHDIGHGIEIKFPDLLDDRRTRHRLPRMAHKEFQERKLLGTEIDGMPAALHRVTYAVQR